MEEEQSYYQEYSNDDEPCTEEYPDDPFVHADQLYTDQADATEYPNDSLIDKDQPYSQEFSNNLSVEYHPYSNEQQQSDQHPFSGERINDDTPLYPGASITVNVTMILLLAFAVRHKLTNEAISDLLYLINTICPKPNNTCKTLYNFKNFFSNLVMPTNFCYYCPDCFSPISSVATTLCSI